MDAVDGNVERCGTNACTSVNSKPTICCRDDQRRHESTHWEGRTVRRFGQLRNRSAHVSTDEEKGSVVLPFVFLLKWLVSTWTRFASGNKLIRKSVLCQNIGRRLKCSAHHWIRRYSCSDPLSHESRGLVLVDSNVQIVEQGLFSIKVYHSHCL